MTETERFCRDWLTRYAPASSVLEAYPEPGRDPWARVEIETDQLGDTITHGVDDTGEFVVLEVLEG